MNFDSTATTLANNNVAQLDVKVTYLSNESNVVEKSGNPGYESGEKLLLRLASGTTVGYSKDIATNGV